MKRKSTTHSASKNNSDYSLAHVLYQKLGKEWYAFTEVDGDCFMSKVDATVAAEGLQSDHAEAQDDSRQPRKRRAA